MRNFPNEIPGESGLSLMRRHDWFLRVMTSLPTRPVCGDRRAVQQVLLDFVDAAGGLEFSRGEFFRIMALSQEEYASLHTGIRKVEPRMWGSATVPAVYYAFFEAVTWTRTVLDRFQEPLMALIHPHDPVLWHTLQSIRSDSGGPVFDDACTLAGVSVHWYSPPAMGCGATVVNRRLIYPIVDRLDDKRDFRSNVRFNEGRHAEMLVEEYWNAVCIFTDRVLDEFYPT